MLTGKGFGERACRDRLVNLAASADRLETTVSEIAAGMAQKSPIALKVSKAIMNRTIYLDAAARLSLSCSSAFSAMRRKTSRKASGPSRKKDCRFLKGDENTHRAGRD